LDITHITTAYDQLKLAQKNLNAFLESHLDAVAHQQLSDVLARVACAQDTLLSAREELVRKEFENRFLREKIGQYENESAGLIGRASTGLAPDRAKRP
jgi:hypothetical protein